MTEENRRRAELKISGMNCAICLKTTEAGADAFDVWKIVPTKNHIPYRRGLI